MTNRGDYSAIRNLVRNVDPKALSLFALGEIFRLFFVIYENIN